MDDQPMYLSQFGAQQPRRRMKLVAVLAGGGALLLVAAAVAAVVVLRPGDRPAQADHLAVQAVTSTVVPAPTTASPSPSQLPGDQITREACADAEALYNRVGSLTEQDTIRAIGVKAQKSSIPEAQAFGTQMVTKADAAIKNKGKDAEFTTTLEASAVVTQFATWCLEGGYVKP